MIEKAERKRGEYIRERREKMAKKMTEEVNEGGGEKDFF